MLTLTLSVALAFAASTGPTPSVENSFRNADEIVVGSFTGESRVEVTQANVSDPATGEQIVRDLERQIYTFEVTDVLAVGEGEGVEIGDYVEVEVPPGFVAPPDEVAMGVAPGRHADLTMRHGHYLETSTPEGFDDAVAMVDRVRRRPSHSSEEERLAEEDANAPEDPVLEVPSSDVEIAVEPDGVGVDAGGGGAGLVGDRVVAQSGNHRTPAAKKSERRSTGLEPDDRGAVATSLTPWLAGILLSVVALLGVFGWRGRRRRS